MGFLLFIVAWMLKFALSPILLSYGLLRCTYLGASAGYEAQGFWGLFVGAWLMLNNWFEEMACAMDQFGNVLGMYAWNDLLVRDKKDDDDRVIVKAYPAGDRQFTISYFLGRNAYLGTLAKAGPTVVQGLDLLEDDHVRKANTNGNRRILRTAFELEPPPSHGTFQ